MIDAGTGSEQWLALLAGVIALNVLVMWATHRAAGGTRGEARRADVSPEDGVVACPECGVTNELGYRFCRRCVGELPGADGRATARGPSRSGSAF